MQCCASEWSHEPVTNGTGSNDRPESPKAQLTPEARRALAEARARREEAQRQTEFDASAQSKTKQREIGGPAGPEPTRYGDWERKGIASDF